MSTENRPNILLIVSDDHGYGDFTHRGAHDVTTHRLDELFASATSFDQGYVTAPICSASRAAMISGAHQRRWGVRWFGDSQIAPPSYRLLPELLGGAGYRTGYFGKVHYGADVPGTRACPENHGFDRSLYGLSALGMGRLHYLHHSRRAVAEYGEAAAVHGVHPLYDGGVETDCERHLTQEFAQRAIDFIGEEPAEDSPFFAMVAFNAVHNFTWQLPPEELAARGLPEVPDFDAEADDYDAWYDASISPRLDHGRAFYAAQLELMDREIGRMLDHLEATGTAESTIVVYLTDNGGSTCNFGDNTPLHGTKYTLYEGGVRVPFAIRWPGVATAGAQLPELVSSMDLLPTLAAAAGIQVPPAQPVDGEDLRPLLEGRGGGHDMLHFDTGFQWSVRTDRWKLRWADPDSPQRRSVHRIQHTEISPGLSLVPIEESLDESAAADVSAQHPEVVAELTAAHEAWLDAIA